MKKPEQRPQDRPRSRPRNREVENEMVGLPEEEGEPPRPATEPKDAAARNGAKD